MNNRSLQMIVTVNASQPKLLEGLEVWLRLGLINDSQVKQLSQTYLTCPLPQTFAVISDSRATLSAPETEFAEEKIAQVAPPLSRDRKNLLARIWQSFKDELSVRWLLFLGLFLVVVSSGVLAATQWEKFPATGQYLILWAYTLIFWGIGFWAGQRENLQLTYQTLQTITLLLIPVNFWAIDTFGLWSYPWGWLVATLSFISLTGICFLQNRLRNNLFLVFNFLGLSYVHWGWQLSTFPLIAVYIGMVATAIILRFLPVNTLSIANGRNFVIYALSVLLIRAIFVVHLPLEPLGLAIGICGWLMQGERERKPTLTQAPVSKFLEIIGAILLFLGWFVSVEEFPWQAIIVSGLALQFFVHRLRQNWLRRDILAIFLIGLQTLFLIGKLVPIEFRQAVITFWMQISHSPASSQSIYSLTLFPYIIAWVWLSNWLSRQEKVKVARFGEWLTLGLGVTLTLISLPNPMARSLNLFLSSATLTYFISHCFPIRKPLIYLANILGLLTICSTCDWLFSPLNQLTWAVLLLFLMVIEWGVSTRQTSTSELSWQQTLYLSCWHIGFVLASLSYFLLWQQIETFLFSQEDYLWGLLWLITPLTLTAIASRTSGNRRLQAASFSCGALGLIQSLTLWQDETRLISLGMATGLMFLNSYYSRYLITAVIQIAFTLSFLTAVLWSKLALSGWFVLGAITIFILWSLHTLLKQKNNSLALLYAQATEGWAIALCVIELILLTYQFIFSYANLSHDWNYLMAAIIIASAILYRYCKSPTNQAVYGITWAIEIGITEGNRLINGSTLTLAIINILLSLITLIATNWLLTKRPLLAQLISLKTLPLTIALIGVIWRWGDFNAYTGLITLGAALIGIGVGARLRNGRIITYFSLAAISLACYELVLYQLLQSPQRNLADSLTILAIVATAIALIYRIFAWYWYHNRNTFLNLSIKVIIITAHLHWGMGSILKLLAAKIAIDTTPRLTFISIIVCLSLAAYALIQARHPGTREENTASNWWVYIGLLEVIATAIYARFIWAQLSILDPYRVIIICIFALAIYQMPWRSLGWQSTPWHRAAVIMPALTTLIIIDDISYLSLLVVAAFYVCIAIHKKNIRWSYISLGLIDWAIARFLLNQYLLDILWYAAIMGLSFLYIAQFDTDLVTPQKRKSRHYFRIYGSGIICLSALLFHQDTGLIPALISLVTLLIGLGLRIRAFLFVGTITFILTIVYQLIILCFEYSFLKWIIGLMIGVSFISIAANFERRREAITTVFQNWFAQLTQWE